MTYLTKYVTQYDMTRYSGEGNIHSDPAVAESAGLDRTIAQGMMTLAYASELMTMVCGDDWLSSGRISVTFVAPVYAGDEVTVSAAETEAGYQIRAENQDGSLVMAGEATM